MFRTFSRFTLAALLLSSVGCVSYEEEWEDDRDWYDDVDLQLDPARAALSGQLGRLTARGVATSAYGWTSSYGTQIEVRDDHVTDGTASAFTYLDFTGELLQNAEPGTVYYAAYDGDSALLDDNGDSYVRIDDDTEVIEDDSAYVAVCTSGNSDLGVDLDYDEPADEVMVQVEVLDTIERPVAQTGTRGELTTAGDDEAVEDPAALEETDPELKIVEVIEVRVAALVYQRDGFGSFGSGYRIVNTKFVMER